MSKAMQVRIENQLMLAELELDGIKTHISMRKEQCPLYKTPFYNKVRRALKAVRSSRDLFRMQNKVKQWTLTTRGGSNRHGLWDSPWRPDWKCPYCKASPTDCPECFMPMEPRHNNSGEIVSYECVPCMHEYCLQYLIDWRGYKVRGRQRPQ